MSICIYNTFILVMSVRQRKMRSVSVTSLSIPLKETRRRCGSFLLRGRGALQFYGRSALSPISGYVTSSIPRSTSAETRKKRAICLSCEFLGSVKSVSQCETVLLLVPSACASSACDSPLFKRNARKVLPIIFLLYPAMRELSTV